jgi:hypothetical protein
MLLLQQRGSNKWGSLLRQNWPASLAALLPDCLPRIYPAESKAPRALKRFGVGGAVRAVGCRKQRKGNSSATCQICPIFGYQKFRRGKINRPSFICAGDFFLGKIIARQLCSTSLQVVPMPKVTPNSANKMFTLF